MQEVPLHPSATTHAITMDASNDRFGPVCGPLSARGACSRDHVGLHIDYLQMETVYETLKRFQK